MDKTITIQNLHDIEQKSSRPGIKGAILFDEKTPTKNIFSGIFTLESGGTLDMHYHDREEMQHVIKGSGILSDAKNIEYKVGPGTTFYCPVGPKGAHEIRNTSDVTFVCLYVYNSPGGKRVSLSLLTERER
jgi:oxalate decarboxylase/phosphoglucose isomerase-like protein (cupin superfamily)